MMIAEAAIDQDKKADAREAIGRVLAVNPRHLQALSLKAALFYVEGQETDYRSAIDAVLGLVIQRAKVAGLY